MCAYSMRICRHILNCIRIERERESRERERERDRVKTTATPTRERAKSAGTHLYLIHSRAVRPDIKLSAQACRNGF